MLTDDILTEGAWEQNDHREIDPDQGLSTEFAPQPHPAWESCLDALLAMRNTIPDGPEENDEPNRVAIDGTLCMLVEYRKQRPLFPPTLITKEPCGGIIVEWRWNEPNGTETLIEITVYNDRRAELTIFQDGKVIDLQSIILPVASISL